MLWNNIIQTAMELSKNIIILGDLNEDLFSANYRNLLDALRKNSFQNIIDEPTRGMSLLDPIIIPNNLTAHDSGACIHLVRKYLANLAFNHLYQTGKHN